jgi:hypothetical protein
VTHARVRAFDIRLLQKEPRDGERSLRMTILWIILIVVVILALLGFLGRGRW